MVKKVTSMIEIADEKEDMKFVRDLAKEALKVIDSEKVLTSRIEKLLTRLVTQTVQVPRAGRKQHIRKHEVI